MNKPVTCSVSVLEIRKKSAQHARRVGKERMKKMLKTKRL